MWGTVHCSLPSRLLHNSPNYPLPLHSRPLKSQLSLNLYISTPTYTRNVAQELLLPRFQIGSLFVCLYYNVWVWRILWILISHNFFSCSKPPHQVFTFLYYTAIHGVIGIFLKSLKRSKKDANFIAI